MFKVIPMLLLSTAMIDPGWNVRKDGSLDYIVQIEPALQKRLVLGEKVTIGIDTRAKKIKTLTIQYGTGPIPRANLDHHFAHIKPMTNAQIVAQRPVPTLNPTPNDSGFIPLPSPPKKSPKQTSPQKTKQPIDLAIYNSATNPTPPKTEKQIKTTPPPQPASQGGYSIWWMIFICFLLFVSIGINAYLAFLWWEERKKCEELLAA